jgi:hypothetical protein
MRTKIFDLEVYRNYFLVAFRDVDTGAVRTFEMYEGQDLDIKLLRKMMGALRVVSFNGKRFDAPIIAYALEGADCAELKLLANEIINRNLQPWQAARQFGFDIPEDWDHIDIFDVAPGMASLKIYAGRLHSTKLQDLPIHPDDDISPEQREILKDYCVNGDTVATLDLWNKLRPQIELREKMSAEYGIDLRSKSDAQIAEAVIRSKVSHRLQRKIERPEIAPGTVYRYKAPGWLTFQTDPLRRALELTTSVEFCVSDGGGMLMPKELSTLKIAMGSGVYQMGIGGLHSTESCVSHWADADTVITDRDVASYYPAIILGCRLYPRHLGEAFLHVYREIVDRRLAAKRSGDTVTADALKITINGSFGKLGSKWSTLYSPDLLIQTTVTGQLALLMLIESFELAGATVISANTDGVVTKCPRDRIDEINACVIRWEGVTGFQTEATEYRALYSRDVNNYIAIKPDGSAKMKGVFAPAALNKNPTNEICSAAVVQFLKDGTRIERTIAQCSDVRKFVTVRQVKGGGVDQAGNYLGRAVRWYYSSEESEPLRYKVNGYKIPRSEGARPLMQLPEAVPADLNRGWYVDEAYNILMGIGFANDLA